MSKKVSEKSRVFNARLVFIRNQYKYLTMKEAITLASLETTIDGYSGPVLGSDIDIAWVLTKVKIREMPAKVSHDEWKNIPLIDKLIFMDL